METNNPLLQVLQHKFNYYVQCNEALPRYAVVRAELKDGTRLESCAVFFDNWEALVNLLNRDDFKILEVLQMYREYGEDIVNDYRMQIYDNF